MREPSVCPPNTRFSGNPRGRLFLLWLGGIGTSTLRATSPDSGLAMGWSPARIRSTGLVPESCRTSKPRSLEQGTPVSRTLEMRQALLLRPLRTAYVPTAPQRSRGGPGQTAATPTAYASLNRT